MSDFNKVLIANRGEIAVRVIRSAQAAGYRTVAVYSEADINAPHVNAADEAVLIGPAPVSESYLDANRIFDAALKTEADAIHPGYGFLSENADFARSCKNHNITFIGPPADAIELMGSKRLSKIAMLKAGVPCIPGYEGSEQDNKKLIIEAEKIGFPLMVKASAGGGGRGMRVAQSATELPELLQSARNEAKNAFGSDELILEKQIIGARHVEIQVFADNHGHVVHLGERDCSVQRRHQKVLEEAPSPAVNTELRTTMGEAAVQAARACHYRGAGTVEFLLTSEGEFYFLEMNTRLQVEHPVTELVTGQDLVCWQLDVAAGRQLPLSQKEIPWQGHAIEARLYAEDPEQNFLPQTGVVQLWQPAEGDGIRTDSGIQTGQVLSAHYDPMLAKIITYGRDRTEALRKLHYALEKTTLLGVPTNRPWLSRIVKHTAFSSGEFATDFLEKYASDNSLQPESISDETLALAALLSRHKDVQPKESGWKSTFTANHVCLLSCNGQQWALELSANDKGCYQVSVGKNKIRLAILSIEDKTCFYQLNDVRRSVGFSRSDNILALDTGENYYTFEDRTLVSDKADKTAGNGQLCASMDGQIVATIVMPGENVKQGETIVVLEAMKMEHQLKADCDGTLTELQVAEGDQVKNRQLLATITPAQAKTDTTTSTVATPIKRQTETEQH